MKPLPRFWARHHEVVSLPDGEFALTMTGSSDRSQEDAARDARERLAALVAAGGPRGLREGGEYYPDRRRPEELLEEIHSPEGALIAAITRNRYGAAVLNTDAVLIADIDIPGDTDEAASRSRNRGGSGGGLLSRLFGRGSSRPQDADQAPGAKDGDPDLFGEPGHGQRGEEHQRILGRIGQFCADRPDLGVRTYRTRNGFRLLITGTGAGPDSAQARELLEQVGTDELYTLLCRVHDTYRARLTPKPWRVGLRAAGAPGPARSETGSHQKWVRRYEAACAEVAVCHFIGAAGPQPDPLEQQIIDLHDRAVRYDSGLRLA